MDVSAKYPKHFASKFRINRAIVQVIPSGAWTVIQWDNQTYDILEEALIANPWTFTPLESGYYLLHAQVTMQLNALGDEVGLEFRRNALSNMTTGYDHMTAVGNITNPQITVIQYLNAGDTVDVRVHQNSGINRQIGNVVSCYFTGLRVG